ncbi:aldehyde dehydrogenase (NADP(+)) [Alishewanella sp. d11]|uniref:aldehyde dehydrogenase (NADP(+)) n=1 Tax=Alishewanella sp. d11 TaxID=3414030 RepID=UPI003BF7B5EC
MISGQHFIAGQWVGEPLPENAAFNPMQNTTLPWHFAEAGMDELALVTKEAQAAFLSYRHLPANQRADFLEQIAQELEHRRDSIVHTFVQESALAEARAQMELGRTCNQLRLFASELRHPEADCVVPAMPERQPLPRPALRLRKLPLGPVVVFAASNFPLAFSVAGGDTTAALAAGCPVIVKAHNAHPATSELAAQAIAAAAANTAMPKGVFALVHARQHAFSEALIQHPAIKAVAFTGSEQLGMHFQRLIWQRPQPIPFFGELGSQNPLFVLPGYLAQQGESFAQQLAQSVLNGCGQFCTRPALVFIPAGSTTLINLLQQYFSAAPAGAMLTPKIAAHYRHGCQELLQSHAARLLAQGQGNEEGCHTLPRLFISSLACFLTKAELQNEIFGPATVLIEYETTTQLQELALQLPGQLTATLFATEQEFAAQQALLQNLELLCGRMIFAQMPTGVEVCPAMQHGGPFPASTDSRFTAVGSRSIDRFLRPVCYQNFPE